MLKGKQKNLDKNKDGKITGEDFKMMKAKYGKMMKAKKGVMVTGKKEEDEYSKYVKSIKLPDAKDVRDVVKNKSMGGVMKAKKGDFMSTSMKDARSVAGKSGGADSGTRGENRSKAGVQEIKIKKQIKDTVSKVKDIATLKKFHNFADERARKGPTGKETYEPIERRKRGGEMKKPMKAFLGAAVLGAIGAKTFGKAMKKKASASPGMNLLSKESGMKLPMKDLYQKATEQQMAKKSMGGEMKSTQGYGAARTSGMGLQDEDLIPGKSMDYYKDLM